MIVDALREHRVGVLSWIVGGGAFNWFETYALHIEMDDFVGGPKALAASVMPAIEAMRPLRWPAERLDTLGGYLTFHNLLMFQGFLAIYAAVQGVHCIRRPEDEHSLEQVLATGWSRLAYARDRILGNVVALALISLGLGASVAFSLAFVGEPQTADAFVTMAVVGLVTLVAFGWGLTVGQLFRSRRACTGAAVIPLVVLYLVTNEWENLGWLGALRFLSPFHLANSSRALVPGYGFDLPSSAVLLGMAGALTATGVAAYVRRDYGGVLWSRLREDEQRTVAAVRTQRWWLARPWRELVFRHRLALLAWTLSTAGFAAMFMALEPAVVEAWGLTQFIEQMLGAPPGAPLAPLYVSFMCDTLAPFVVAYAVSNGSGWVADLREGRVETVLAAPLSWSHLVTHRLCAAVGGAGLIAFTWLAVSAGVAAWVGADADLAGFGRSFALCLLIAWAAGSLTAVLVAWTRSVWATTCLIIYVVVAYVLSWFVAILHWPAWLSRLSVFDAYAHPYQAWPTAGNLAILVGVGVIGLALAARIAERSPKIA